jgi:hypothetical protein
MLAAFGLLEWTFESLLWIMTALAVVAGSYIITRFFRNPAR